MNNGPPRSSLLPRLETSVDVVYLSVIRQSQVLELLCPGVFSGPNYVSCIGRLAPESMVRRHALDGIVNHYLLETTVGYPRSSL